MFELLSYCNITISFINETHLDVVYCTLLTLSTVKELIRQLCRQKVKFNTFFFCVNAFLFVFRFQEIFFLLDHHPRSETSFTRGILSLTASPSFVNSFEEKNSSFFLKEDLHFLRAT